MPRMIYDYTKSTLEKVSFDPKLFRKELLKALRYLLPYEIEQLTNWLRYFTNNKPELQYCLLEIGN
jgi:DNA replication protein DnaD